MLELGKLANLRARTLWPTEAHDFTPWLAQELDRLGEELEMDLELVRTESEVGDFSIDVLARDLGRDRLVVIENQLEPTDHTHLGQVITYAAGVEAGVVVWICSEFRDEHRRAIDWLNRGLSSTTEFYGVVVEVLQIDDSKPAVTFRIVASPSERKRAGGSSGGAAEPTPKAARYQAFFQRLIDDLRDKHKFTNAKAGQPQSWYSFSSGVRGFSYGVNFRKHGRFCVEIYIDGRDEDWNLGSFRALQADKAKIEAELGEPLLWEDLENRRACRITCFRTGSIEDAQDKLEEYREWAIERVLKLKSVLQPRIRTLPGPHEGGEAEE